MRNMGGKEKKILVIANVPNYQGSDKKTLCNESVSKKNGKLFTSAVPPPIPMSPIVEKMEGLKAIRNRSNSLRLGRLAFYRHLEKVETMRCFWELKHVELEGGNNQVMCRALLVSDLLFRHRWLHKRCKTQYNSTLLKKKKKKVRNYKCIFCPLMATHAICIN
ncbi:hypothetical protein INR49_000705 [Caranx melampygus]|nr:hypothetical protein INR49_000705 [Caranx melampygus]